MATTASDEYLLHRWTQHHDAAAFGAIADRYSGLVYGTCRRILRDAAMAEDAVQETFETLAGPASPVPTHLGGWLHTVAVHRALSRLRSERRRRLREHRYAVEAPVATKPSWDDVAPLIDEAVAALPDKFRVPILRHFLEGESQERIAGELGITRQAVAYRIQRGVKLIRRSLKHKGVAVGGSALGAFLYAGVAEAVPASVSAALTSIAVRGPSTSAAVTLSVSAPTGAGLATNVVGTAVAIVLIAGAALFARPFLSRSPGEPPHPAATPAAGSLVAAATGREAVLAEAAPSAAPVEKHEEAVGEPIDVSVPAEAQEGYVKGKVVDARGDPVCGCDVIIEQLPPRQTFFGEDLYRTSTITGPDGHFEVNGLPLVETMQLSYLDGRNAFVALACTRGAVAGEAFWPFRGFNQILLELKPCGQVAGRVLGPEGEPVVGARVVPASGHGSYEVEARDLPLTTATNASGYFVLQHLRGDRARLFVDAPGYAPLLSDSVVVGGDGVVLKLTRGGSVQGTVIEAASGACLPGVSVEADVHPFVYRGIEWKTITDGAGMFRFDGIPPDATVSLYARNEEWRVSTDRDWFSVSDGNVVKVKLAATPTISVAGRVYDVGTGQGIPGVTVTSGSHRAETNDTGAYRLGGFGTGECTLELSGTRDYVPAALFEARRSLKIEEGEPPDDVDWPMIQGACIAGVLLTAGGRPLLGAKVTVEGSSSPTQSTEDDGRFAFCGISGGDTCTMKVTAQGFASIEEEIDVPSEGIEELRVVMQPEAVAAGVVLAPDGRPKALLRLQALAEPKTVDRPPWVRTDFEGRFRFEGLPAGEYRIRTFPPDDSERVTLGALHLGAGEHVEDLSYTLGYGTRVEGTVRVGSQPMAGARLFYGEFQTAGKEAFTDAAGHYAMDNVLVDMDTLQCGIQAYGNTSRYMNVKPELKEGESNRVDFDFLGGNAAIAGAVTEYGQPVTVPHISVEPDGADASLEYIGIDNSEDGAFHAEHLPEGPLTLVVDIRTSGSTSLVKRVPCQGVAGQVTQVNIDLSATTLVMYVAGCERYDRVECSLFEGARAVPARYPHGQWVEDSAKGSIAERTTGGGEEIRVPGLAPGEYTVVVVGHLNGEEELAAVSAIVDVADQPEIVLEFEMP